MDVRTAVSVGGALLVDAGFVADGVLIVYCCCYGR